MFSSLSRTAGLYKTDNFAIIFVMILLYCVKNNNVTKISYLHLNGKYEYVPF